MSILLKKKDFFFKHQNKIALIFFICLILIFSFFFFLNLKIALQFPYNLQRSILGDSFDHIRLLIKFSKELEFYDLHFAKTYSNNYYIFGYPFFLIYNLLFTSEYVASALALATLNCISLSIFFIFFYLTIFNISKNFLISVSTCFFLICFEFFFFTTRIYPDVLQFSLISVSYFYLFSNKANKYLYATIFASLAFGTKAQGLIIFCFILFFHFFKNLEFKFNVVKHLVYKSLILIIVFFLVYYLFNQVNLFKEIYNLFKLNSGATIHKFSNFEKINEYIINDIIKNKFNFFTIIILFLFSALNFNKQNTHKVDIFLIIIFLTLSYIHFINMKTLVEGPRYLYHLLPAFGILLAVFFKNFKFYLGNKIFLFTILIFLINNLYLASNILSNIYDLRDSRKLYERKSLIQKIEAGNQLKDLNINKSDVVCASKYSYIHESISNVNQFWYLDEINLTNCDFISLDKMLPGIYFWLNKNENGILEIKINRFEDLGEFWKKFGIERYNKTLNIFKTLLSNESEFDLVYSNNFQIIFKKK